MLINLIFWIVFIFASLWFTMNKNITIVIIIGIIIVIGAMAFGFSSISDVSDTDNGNLVADTNLDESVPEGKTITINLNDGIGVDDQQ